MEICNNLVCRLKEMGLTISFMESCTGGTLCNSVTNVEHCSSVFIGGYITYTNSQKIKCGVPKEVMDRYGVYSKQCAFAMANACKENTGSDISVGITGTLGNIDKNNSDSEIGKIYVCVLGDKKATHHEINLTEELNSDRQTQKNRIVCDVFNFVNAFLN